MRWLGFLKFLLIIQLVNKLIKILQRMAATSKDRLCVYECVYEVYKLMKLSLTTLICFG